MNTKQPPSAEFPAQLDGTGPAKEKTAFDRKILPLAAVAALLLTISALPASGEVINGVSYIDGVTVNSFSSEITWSVIGYRAAANTVNGSGLDTATGLHDKTATDEWMIVGTTGWAANGPRQPDPLPGPYITYDLGAFYDLSSIHIWNFDEGDNANPSDHTGNIYGAQGVEIAASATTTFGPGASLTFAQETTGLGSDYPFNAAGVRYVKFTLTSNYGGGAGLTGLAEVRFQGEPFSAPVAPAIALTSPTNSQTLFVRRPISVTATAENGTPPYTVAFYTNSAGGPYGEAGVISSPPYTVDLGALAAGTYSIYAMVTDSATPTPMTATSATNTFSVALGEVINGVTYIGGVTIESVTSENLFGLQRPAVSIVNGVGLNALAGQHGNDPYHPQQSMWHGDWNTGNPQVIVFNLGAIYDLSQAHVWNFNEPGDGNGNFGVKDLTISTSADGVNYSPPVAYVFAPASGLATDPGKDYDLVAAGVQYVKFSITSNYRGAYSFGPGLSEVRFLAASGIVAPKLSTPPLGGTYLVGTPLTLGAIASGTEPLSYQWFKGGSAIADATEPSLSFASLELSDAGTYQLVVSNSGGSVTSSPVVLKIEATLPAKLLQYQNAIQQALALLSEYAFDRLDASDVIGTHDGTLAGNTAFGDGVAGGADKALVLTGSGHVQLGVVPDFEFGSGIGAVEAWVRADWPVASPPGYSPCVFANRDGSTTRWSVHLTQTKDQLVIYNGSDLAYAPIPNAGTNWHHLASVFDNGNWRVYWDGALFGTFAIVPGASTGLPTQLGSSSASSTTEGWMGALDEVAFYGDILTAEDIAAHARFFAVAQPIVGVRNGSFEQTEGGTLIPPAPAYDILKPVAWNILTVGSAGWDAGSTTASGPQGNYDGIAASNVTEARYLRLASDKSNQGYGAVAQLLGTMVAGQTYTISADAFGGNGNVAWIGTAQLQSDAGISPTVYATSTSGGLAAGVFAADGLSASYTAGPADEGQPLWIKFSVPVPPEANTAMRGGIDNVRLTVIGAPKLTIAQRGNQVTISWPAEATGFVLECTDQLPATSWIEVPGVIGNFVTETIDAKAKFYRLRK